MHVGLRAWTQIPSRGAASTLREVAGASLVSILQQLGKSFSAHSCPVYRCICKALITRPHCYIPKLWPPGVEGVFAALVPWCIACCAYLILRDLPQYAMASTSQPSVQVQTSRGTCARTQTTSETGSLLAAPKAGDQHTQMPKRLISRISHSQPAGTLLPACCSAASPPTWGHQTLV